MKNLSSVRPVTAAMNEVMGSFFKLISGLIIIYCTILNGMHEILVHMYLMKYIRTVSFSLEVALLGFTGRI